MIFKCVESGPKEVYQVSWSSKLTTEAYMVDPKKRSKFAFYFTIFEVFALGGRRTKANFKDRDKGSPSGPLNGTQVVPKQSLSSLQVIPNGSQVVPKQSPRSCQVVP